MAAPIRKMLPARFCVILLIFMLTDYSKSSKLNLPRLLLPYYSSVASNFTLEVSSGCFTWRTTRPEIASVSPVGLSDPAQCSSKAVVMATSRVAARKTAVVIAQDPLSGHQLRCDVIVDEIKTIDVETTTHELYLDDSPEEFVIRGMNDEGDVFSTLEGLSFEWTLMADTGANKHSISPGQSVLRFIKFSESEYQTPYHIGALESQGKRGDRILVRGIRTGSAKVSVRMEDPVYKHVNEPVVRIIVVANIQLNPPIVYLMQHTTVTYKVELIKQGKAHTITMPSEQYHLEVESDTICKLDSATSTVTALDMGDTEIRLKDKHISVAGVFREPTGGIFVVNPGYLEFSVLPGKLWVLETGRVYEIFIDIYDKESHHIYPANGIRVEAQFNTNYFQVLQSSENGTYHIVKTLSEGFTLIDGLLDTVITQDGVKHTFEPPVQNSQDVEIYSPIHVEPQLLVLPWEAAGDKPYHYQLQATGGSGNYTWSSSDTSVATVTTVGEVVTGSRVGDTTVRAADAKNPAHSDSMKTYVLPPDNLQFLPARVEAEIGTELELPLSLSVNIKEEKVKVNDCQKMPFVISVHDANIFQHVGESLPSMDGACTMVKVKANSLGTSKVTVTYSYKDVVLRAEVTIAAYKPLKPLDPEQVAVVTLSASKEIIFEGGPQPWVLDPNRYYQEVETEKDEMVSKSPVRAFQKIYHAFRVDCKSVGEQQLKLSVGNRPTAKNPYPASSTAGILFVCEQPKGLRLIPIVKQPENLPPCPINAEQDDPIIIPGKQDAGSPSATLVQHYIKHLVPAPNYSNLEMRVVVTDSEGRSFDNFSSLAFEWQISNNELATFTDDTTTMFTRIIEFVTGVNKVETYKTLAPKGKVGMLTVIAKVKGYQSLYFTTGDGLLPDTIQASRVINFVEDAEIVPDYLTIYNHESIKGSLNVNRGSGHFHLDHGDTDFAKLQYKSSNRAIQIVPVSEGTFILTAFDLCLETRSPARATVFISEPHRIMLTVVDKVEQHKEIEAHVQVRDMSNNLIPAKHFSLMHLTHKMGSDIIALRPSPKKMDDDYTAHYIVKGVSLGRTSLAFVTDEKHHKPISSKTQMIQVFPPLRLDPRNITLLTGAVFQVLAYGGPQPESTIEFSMKDEDVASVSSSGLVTAEDLGSGRVSGQAVGLNSESGVVVYSQDSVTVNVVQLEGIKIFAPLKRLQTGTQMPIYVMGINENETPFSFGSSSPPLQFEWRVSSRQVATVRPLFYKSTIEPTPDNNFAVRLFAEETGHVTVTVTVRASDNSNVQIANGGELSDDIQIQVFEKLRLVTPTLCDGTIIMTPNTDTLVRTNREGSSALVTFSVIDSDGQRGWQEPVVMVTDTGHLLSAGQSGQASLLITSHEDFGVNQSIVILIKVKPISYLMINAENVIHTSGERLVAVPLGTPLQFSISFHDDVGENFYATNSKVLYRANRFDLLQIGHGGSNDSLVAKATNVGSTVLKVWDSQHPGIVDYVNVVVDYAVQPSQRHVTLGDIICFQSPLVTSTGGAGMWHESSSVIQIDPSSGVALAANVGTSSVSYNVSSTTLTSTVVTVKPVTRVSLKNDHIPSLTNVVSKKSANVIPLVLEDDDKVSSASLHGVNCSEVVRERNYNVWRLPVKCEAWLTHNHPLISMSDLLQINAEFNHITGEYQCQLRQSGGSDMLQSISTLETSVAVRAMIPKREGQPHVQSETLTLPFLPAFYVHNPELQLNNVLPTASLRISATEKVAAEIKVTSSDESLVRVESPERHNQQDYSLLVVIVLADTSTLWDRSPLQASLKVRCALTGQQVNVPVDIKLIGQKPQHLSEPSTSWSQLFTMLANNYHNIIFAALCVIATISCIIIAYHAVLGQRQQASSTQPNVFMTPGHSPMNQNRTGSPMSSPYSPYNVTQTSPRLWSVDPYPYEGSGIFHRSPGSRSPDKM